MGVLLLNERNYSGSGGGNSNDQELTWNEYQALSDAEKNNGTNYYITDVNSDGTLGEFQPIIYSEDEREIGVWIDGKPLYSQTFTGQINNTTIYTIPNITVDNLISFNGFLIDGVGYKFNIPYRDNTDYISIRLNPTNAIDLIVTSYFTTADYKINLCYTKTTDQPGSGTWTPQGVPAVHYDSNEKIVGTWFGETLYEKTYALHNLSGSPSDWTSVEEISVSTLVKVIGTLYKSNGEICSADNTSIRFCYNPQIARGCLCYYYDNDQSNITDMYLTFQYTKSSS